MFINKFSAHKQAIFGMHLEVPRLNCLNHCCYPPITPINQISIHKPLARSQCMKTNWIYWYFLVLIQSTSCKSSNFGFCNESLGSILAISSEKLPSFFYGVFPKTICVSFMHQTHMSNGSIVQFFDNFTLNMYSSVKIIAILWCISLGYLNMHPKNCLSECCKFIYNDF